MQGQIFVEAVREFNRFYTANLGLLNQSILESEYSLSQVRVLYEIAHTKQCTSTQLYSLLQMDAGYVSRILKDFEKDSLIRKEKSSQDARSQIISLTDKGKQVFEQLNTKSNTQIQGLSSQMSFSQKETLLNCMHAIRQLLSNDFDKKITARQIHIRTELQPADIGYIIYLHGFIYKQEYNYGLEFEVYVAAGLYEFYKQYDPASNRIWICEHAGRVVGCLALMNRGKAAQLRYFLIRPEYRGMGLGKKLMDLYMDFLKKCHYQSTYLLTTHEQQPAANLYKSYGFRLTEEKASTIFGKPIQEQRYDLNLHSH